MQEAEAGGSLALTLTEIRGEKYRVSVMGWFQEVQDIVKARVRNKASHEASLVGVQSATPSVHIAFSSGFHATSAGGGSTQQLAYLIQENYLPSRKTVK